MKKPFRKTLALLLSAMMIISIIPLTASAETYGDLTYTITNGEVTIIDCDESVTEVVIPETIDGYPVTTIGYQAFYNCSSLKNITIPNSVTWIGGYAFDNCTSLTSVTIPNSVTSIVFAVFASCTSLTSVTIPDSVTTIGDYAFSGCTSLTSITIPDSVTRIGHYAFFYCTSLASITIPDSVTSIGDSAFSTCTSLTSITVDENNKTYSNNEDGVLFNKDKTTLILYPIGNERTTYTIPDGVTSIGNDAFQGCTSLTSIIIPDSVTSIGNDAFYECSSLTNITIGNSVTSIGDHAFNFCTSLTNITIPDSVTSIGNYAFSSCKSLTSITIPDSVTSIDELVFEWCTSLISITVDENNKYYSSDKYGVLFNKDKTILIKYPAGNTRTSYVVPDSVTSIDNYAFSHSDSLTNIAIPNGVTSIRDFAFSNCYSLMNITIPDSVTSVSSYTFYACYSLMNITIPDNVTRIDDSAFYYCSALKSITINNPECKIYDVKNTIYSGATIYGYCESTAHDYAEKHSRNFRCLESVAEVTPPTCTEQGFTTYTCSTCGGSYVADYFAATGHNYVNFECTGCGDVKEVVADKSGNTDCSCSCHSKNPFTKVIYKFIILLCKLFRLNHRQFCGCGAAHW